MFCRHPASMFMVKSTCCPELALKKSRYFYFECILSYLSPLGKRTKLGSVGAGKPTAKIIAECADMYAFAAKAIGAAWQAGDLERSE